MSTDKCQMTRVESPPQREGLHRMMTRQIHLVASTLCCVAILALSGCSKGVTHDSSPATNTNGQSAIVTSSPTGQPSPTAKPRTPGGDPIDTTALDTQIAEAEKNHKNGPGDDAARVALAHAYLARADALTNARQYSSALGDYRRTLKYDPQNKEATDMSATIISIFKSMGREAPAEGKEPPPLPLTDKAQETDTNKQKSY